jgi:hypothetical protein
MSGTPRGAMVDVSNVCWSQRLPPQGRHTALLSRLDLVCEAWRRRSGEDAPLELVADASLLRNLQGQERQELRRLERAGDVRLVPYADPELLGLAQERGWSVISADRFVDHRREHPWISEQPDRFLAWETGDDGTVRLVPSGITSVTDQVVSRAVEGKQFAFGHHIDVQKTAHQRILRSHWRCAAPGCLTAQRWPDRLLDWPYLRNGTPVCVCGEPLEELGPRGEMRGFVVREAGSGRELVRFPVSVGSAVLLGRGPLPHGINLAAEGRLSPAAARRLSRRHLRVAVDAGRGGPHVTVTELHSRNGTEIVRLIRRRKLDPERPAPLGEEGRVILAGVAELRLSGRRYFLDRETTLPSTGVAGAGATETLGDLDDTAR